MEKYMHEPGAKDEDGVPKDRITNELLLKWIDKYLDPKEWFIDITGGEPGLYPEIESLIPALSERGYRGIIRTNGSLPIPESPNFKRIAAWHKQTEGLPKYYDFILILENPEDDWKGKEKYCKDNGIPCAVFPYKFFSTDCSQTTTYPPGILRLFRQVTTVFAGGAIGGCPTSSEHLGPSLLNMDPPIVADLCAVCGNIGAVEYFIIHHYMDDFNITDADIQPFSSFIVYPMLNEKREWVDRNGNVVGVLGDDISHIPKVTVFR